MSKTRRLTPSPRQGLTLIELLICVAIIGVLAAIALPNFMEARTRSRVARTQSDLRTVALAIESYMVDAGVPPYDGEPGFTFYGWVNALSPLTSPVAYLSHLPEDPFQARVWEPTRPGHTHYQNGRHIFDYSTAYWNGVGRDLDVTQVWRAHFGFSAWKLSSVGPDRVPGFGLADLYDPTNGTLSGGDLIRWQGGVEAAAPELHPANR